MMLLHLLLTLFCLLNTSASSREITPHVGDVQVIEFPPCRPPYLTVGSQCLLVGGVTSGGCRSPFVAVGDQCLYFATFTNVNNDEAHQMCHSLVGELVVIDTATKLYDIIHYINDNGLGGDYYWIDGSDKASEGAWTFTSGQHAPLGTPFWWADMEFQEPNNGGGNEHCVQLSIGYFFYMNDVNCVRSYTPLCEQTSQLHINTGKRPTMVPEPVPRVDCPPFFVAVGELCLSFMTWAELTWTEARQSCHGLAGELATITDIQQLRDIYIYLHEEGIAGHSYWLGGSDAASEGVWTWTNGALVPSGAPFWGSGVGKIEPDGDTAENCLLLDAEGFHYFRDDSCTRLANPLCQYLY